MRTGTHRITGHPERAIRVPVVPVYATHHVRPAVRQEASATARPECRARQRGGFAAGMVIWAAIILLLCVAVILFRGVMHEPMTGTPGQYVTTMPHPTP